MNTLRVIFGNVEIYIYVVSTAGLAYLSSLGHTPVWTSSYYDPGYDPNVPQVSSAFTGFFFTLLALILSGLQIRSQQFSLTIRAMLKTLATDCLALVKKMNDYSVTEFRDDTIAYPEVFRKALLDAHHVEYNINYLPHSFSADSLFTVIEKHHDQLRSLKNKYTHKSDDINDIVNISYGIHRSSYAICHTENEYLYSVTSDMISIAAYCVILTSPHVFWSMFGRYLGIIASFLLTFVITGLIEGARNRNVYKEISNVCKHIPNSNSSQQPYRSHLEMILKGLRWIFNSRRDVDYGIDWCREWGEHMYNLEMQKYKQPTTV